MSKKLIHLVLPILVLSMVSYVNANLVGHWKLDEGSGTIALDSSGNGHDGTIQGVAQWGPGPAGQSTGLALMFGTSKCTAINCGVFDPTNGAGLFTITYWAFWDGTGTFQHFLTKSNAWGADTMMLQVELWGAHTNASYTDRVGISYQPAGSVAFSIMPKNEWTHLAWTFDGANLTLFLNGVDEEGSKAFSIGPNIDAPVLIGASDLNGARIFNGLLDDVRVYSHVLSESEIQQTMKGIPPGAASDPSPADKETDVPRDVIMSWTPGEFAPAVNGHRVYFGESFGDVNNAIGGITQSASSYDPGRLNFGTTYYWRVDEVNAPPDSTVFKGDVWSFTTEPVGYPIDGAKITATASSVGQADFGPEKTIDGSGLDENSLHSTTATDMWLSGNEPQGAWIQYEFDTMYKLHEMWVWNSNQIFEALYGFGLKDVTVEYSANGADWTVVPNVPEFAQAIGTADYAHNTTVDFDGAAAKVVKLTATSNWGGLLAQYGLSEVRFFSIPVSAREPSPDTGATDVHPDVTLAWRAGREAATHNVYLSTDQQAVVDGTVSAISVAATSYSTTLDLGNTYYWRVDEVSDAETPSTWQGDVWNFSTPQYLVVDDFEDYNDYPPYEIYSTWLDGYENPANGSQVGYLTPPAVETTIIHGGGQSMPLIYSNAGGAAYSEATRTFSVPQNWARYGIQTLGLWFHGATGNMGELYAKINGVKVPYDGDASNLAAAAWQPWNIDLTTAGVNLASVTTLAIGIDGNAAAGTLYFDDIRLYAYARQFITPVQPDPAGLVGHWAFDESAGTIAADSSGGNDGTLVSGQFQWRLGQGRVGGALSCPGLLDSYVEFPTTGMSPNSGTVALWGNLTSPQPDHTKYFFGHTTIPPFADRIQLYIDTDDTILDMGLGGSHTARTDITTLELETWYHIALTWDLGNYVVYVNGQQAAVGTYSGLTTLNAVADIANDGDTTGREEGFAGLLDEVRIYDRALSYAEIAGLAERTQPFDKPF